MKDMRDKGLIEPVDDSYKIKQTKERNLVEETLAKLMRQCAPFSESEALVFPETLKFLESLFLRKSLSTPELLSAEPPMFKRPLKHTRDECTNNLVLCQTFLKKLEEIERFTKLTEQKFG